jgi:hypothetical protein
MSLVDEEDLAVLCSKLKPFQSKLLRKWVQGLGAEQRAAAFMKDASAAKNHSTSPPLEDKGAEDEDEEENGDEDADADEDEDSDEEDKEVHGGAAGEQGAGDGKSDEDVRIIGQQSETFLTLLLCCERCSQTPPTLALRNVSSACSMPLLERIREVPSGTTLSWQCSRSTTNAISELLLFCVCVCVMRYIFISVLFSLGVRGVCVRCGYEDRIHLGRILEEL